ncbi:MAG: tandem-95 repeat protein, partial [Nitrososphaera sp.]
ATAYVNVTVSSVNDSPVALDGSRVTDEDVASTITLNATDVDTGDSLTFSIVTGPVHGTLGVITGDQVTYTPFANYNGPDSFTFKATDSALADSNVANVTITINPVNDAPVAAGDSYSTDEDTSLAVTAPGVLTNDTDIDSGSLSALLVTTTADGSLVLNANGSFIYNPNLNFYGIDSFTYKANDGSLDSNIVTVTITVNAVNDAPVAVNDAYSTNEDTALDVPALGVLGNDTDVEGDALNANLIADVAHGTLTLNSNGSFIYVPDLNFNGQDSFTYKANDSDLDSDIATVNITVNAINDAPVAVNDTFTTAEDTLLLISKATLAGNDTDVDFDSLFVSSIDSLSTHGTITDNGNGTVTYMPDLNYNGADSFTYIVSDGLLTDVGTVLLTVTAVNDTPVANEDSATTDEDLAVLV